MPWPPADFESHDNDHRLHRAIGYDTPSEMLAGKQKLILEQRDRKLEEAREARAKFRAKQSSVSYIKNARPEDRAMLGCNLSAESMSKAMAVDVVV